MHIYSNTLVQPKNLILVGKSTSSQPKKFTSLTKKKVLEGSSNNDIISKAPGCIPFQELHARIS
jgi:hypothetical protein